MVISARAVRGCVIALGLVVGAAQMASAQGVGSIGGTVGDESGAVLPGATVSLSSPGTIGGDQSTVSDGTGAYQFTRLVPGTYSVKAELQGFRSVVQENIRVNADTTSRADLKLAVGDLAETITVAGAAPLLDTTSALNQTVMTREVLDALPTGNDIWSIARLTPAVTLTKYDVGGREMFGQSSSFVHGSNGSEQGYYIDGMDFNSYSSGTSINFYFDSFSGQELNYQSGQAPAEQARGGVLINLVTKTGTNAFRGTGMFSGTNSALESNNISGALKDQLLAGIPAVVLQVNPDLKLGGEILHLFDTAGTWSGPIMKDRLWFVASAKLGEVYTHRVGSYNADGTLLLNDNQMRNILGKASWAVSSSSQLHYMFSWVHKGRYHVAGGPTVTQFFDTRASIYNPSRNNIHLARWTKVMSSRMVLDVAGSSMEGQTNNLPQKEVQNGDIPRFDSVTRVNSVAASNYGINAGRRTNFTSSLSYVAGTHDVKVGWQFLLTRREGGATSTSHFPAGLRAVYRSGVPDSVNTFNSPTEYTRRTHEHGFYVQDKWRAAQKLTLNIGVRVGKQYGWLDGPLCQVETIFIAGQCFPDVKGVPDFKAVDPRISAIYDMFGDGRTALKFSANRYRIVQDANTDRVNPILAASDTRAWTVCAAGQTSGCDLNRDLIPQLNELGPSTGFNLGTTNRYAADVTWPYSNEIAAEVEQQLPGEVVVSAGYYYRDHKAQIGSTNLLVPASSYTPLQVTESVSGRQVTVYNQDAATRGLFDTVWDNSDALDDSFHGVDLTIQKRMSNRWMVMGSVSLGKSDTNIYGTADQNNPNNSFFVRGPSADTVPVFFKLSGAYELPYGVTVGANGQYFEGHPDMTTVLVNASSARLTQVTQTLVVEPVGTTSLPSVKMVDLNFRKTLSHGTLKLEPRLDIFNIFNAAAITQRITQLGPTYGRAIEVLGARLIKLGVNVTW